LDQRQANKHLHKLIRRKALPPPALHRPHAALRGLPVPQAPQSVSDPEFLHGPKTAQTWKPDHDALPSPVLPALCKAFHHPKANGNTAASLAREQAPGPFARAHSPPLLCKRDSSQSDPFRPLPLYAIPEIPSPVSKCFRPPFVLQSARISRSRCLLS